MLDFATGDELEPNFDFVLTFSLCLQPSEKVKNTLNLKLILDQYLFQALSSVKDGESCISSPLIFNTCKFHES